MDYQQNRNTIEKNLKIGLAASLLLHLLVLLLPALLRGGDEQEPFFKEGYNSFRTTEIDLAQISAFRYEVQPQSGGGGGGGGGTDPDGGGPNREMLSGIPVPSSEPVKVEFNLQSYTPADTSGRNRNLKPGEGFGTGEGSGSGSGKGTGSGSGIGSGRGSGIGDGTTLLPFTPRQILEVIPERESSFSGTIKLSVRIGKDGLVKEHKVLTNTSNSPECLVRVLQAVYKSKWQSVKLEGKVVEYWTEKTYRFE